MRRSPNSLTSIRFTAALALCTLLALSGCGSDKSPVSPGVNPEIINSTDNFQFQVSNVRNFSGSWDYAWNNTGVMAVTDHSSSVTGGSATLTLLDDTGVEVYSRDLSVDGSFNSSSGQTGSWTVRVSLSGATGTFNFRVDKATP